MNRLLPTVPGRIDAAILGFCQDLAPDSCPVFLPIEAPIWAREGECFENVKQMVEESGGTHQYGWAIWRCRNLYLEAEHHAVFRDAEGVLVEVTPRESSVSRILFVPDGEATLDRDGRQRDSVLSALTTDSRVVRLLELFGRRADIWKSARVGHGERAGYGTIAPELLRIEEEIRSLAKELVPDTLLNIWRV